MFTGMSELGHNPGVDPLVRCVSYQVQGYYTKLSQTRAIRQCSLNQFICRTAQRGVIQQALSIHGVFYLTNSNRHKRR